jgi:hypothetical protein
MSRQTYLQTFILVHFSKSFNRPDRALAGELWDKLAEQEHSAFLDEVLKDTSRVNRARLIQYVLASRSALADLVE